MGDDGTCGRQYFMMGRGGGRRRRGEVEVKEEEEKWMDGMKLDPFISFPSFADDGGDPTID